MTNSIGSQYAALMNQFTKFSSKGREFFHLSDGWCVRQVQIKGDLAWRLFWGVLRPGCRIPDYVSTHSEDGAYVEFDEFLDAVSWVEARRGQ